MGGDSTALRLIEFRPWSEINLESPWRDITLEAVVVSCSQSSIAEFLPNWRSCWLLSWAPDEAGQNLEAVLYENRRYLSTGLMLRAERGLELRPLHGPQRRKAGEPLPGTYTYLFYLFSRYHIIVIITILLSPYCWMNVQNTIAYIVGLDYSIHFS